MEDNPHDLELVESQAMELDLKLHRHKTEVICTDPIIRDAFLAVVSEALVSDASVPT